ncbi:MAG: hypothetical protein IPN75_19195, partial [Dechloromonas sp.]|nr:hypothetical protein [Candidatus Dechloromonas phosphorivorans]
MKPTPVQTASYLIAVAILLGTKSSSSSCQHLFARHAGADPLIHKLRAAAGSACSPSGRAARIAATAIVARAVVVAAVSASAFCLALPPEKRGRGRV